MIKKIKQMLKKPFIQGVLVMITGTMGAQIVKMALSPVITRIYGPEAFGVMGVFVSIIQIITPLAALTYPIAIVLPRSDLVAKKIGRISINISILISFLSLIIIFLFNHKIVLFLNIEEISIFLYLIPIVILMSTLMQVKEQWFIRKQQFAINAKATFYQSIIIETSKVGIGLFYPAATVLIILTAISNGIKALLMTFLGKKSNYRLITEELDERGKTKDLIKKYKDFPLLRAPQAFIEAITQSLPVLLLTTLFNPASAGYYTLCRSVLALPTSLLGKSVGDVFYPRINKAAIKKENMSSLITKSVFSLGFIGAIPFGFVIAFGPWIFELVFGDNWSTAGEYARWIAFSTFFRFINEPCIRALPVLSAQFFHLISTIIHTFARVLALIVGFYLFKDDLIAVSLLGIIGGIINALIIVMTLVICKRFEKRNN